MDLMAGNLSRMIFHRFDLPLPIERVVLEEVIVAAASEDMTCAVRGAWVPWIPSAQAAVFPCTIAAQRHRTLRYATLP